MSTFEPVLAEIAEKMEIDQNFTVRHPEYPPRELPAETIARIQQISPQLQQKYLIIQVQNYLYDIYFSHSLMSLEEMTAAAQQPIQVKNNTIDGIDLDFYQRLQHSNHSTGYFDRDWQIVATTDGGELIVVKDGLHLHIDRHQHLPRDFQQADIGSIVPIYLPHNQVGRDTYNLIGNFGKPDRSPSVGLYFNFTPDAAVSIADRLTLELNQLGIPFQFAILHDPSLFYRYDSGTLWLTQAAYLEFQTVLADIYQAHQTTFSPHVPLFSKQLAPGLGIAEVPIGSHTFGMHRCELIATGLVTTMTSDPPIATDKLNSIDREFTLAEIDLQQPHLNLAGRDCYRVF